MLLQCKEVAVSQRLAPFSAAVGCGELIHLLGPNGAGKSSLLACLAGLLPVTGRLCFAGRPLIEWSGNALACQRAYLSQQQIAAGSMPVWHYLTLHQTGAEPLDQPGVMSLCQAFKLEDKLARPLNQLSGGEWQRVRLVAVFCQLAQPEGKLLLLDEPLTGLDLAQQRAFDQFIAARVAAGLTVIMSGHDLNHSLHHAHDVWLMKQGKMVCQGNAERVLQPDILSPVFEVPFQKLTLQNYKILTTLS